MAIKPSKCRAMFLARRQTLFGLTEAGLKIGGHPNEGISTAIPFKFW